MNTGLKAHGSGMTRQAKESGVDRQVIINNMGACGVSCRECIVYEKGDIRYHSSELLSLLGGLDISHAASQRTQGQEEFDHYAELQQSLRRLAEPTCKGCRHGGLATGACRIARCVRENGIDFCHECSEFPCDRSGLDEPFKGWWVRTNRRIKRIGLSKYYEETRNLTRYWRCVNAWHLCLLTDKS